MVKKCIKCEIFKHISEFYKRKVSKDGYNNQCIKCFKIQVVENAKKNPEKIKIRNTKWRLDNKDYCNEYARSRYHANPEPKRQYFQKNKEKINARTRKRRATDPQYKIATNLRRRINRLLEKQVKPGSPIEYLGCSLEFLIKYLESKFEPDMTWENHNQHGWHVDHICQLASFDLTDEKQFKIACHYTNLQPSWAKVNQKKNKHRSFFKLK